MNQHIHEHDPVHHPHHYTEHPSGVEVITYSRLLPFGPGNAVKYVMRRDHKSNAVEDLNKAIWYLTDSIDYDVSYPLTPALHKAIRPVIEAEENDAVKAFLLAMYGNGSTLGILWRSPSLWLARDVLIQLRDSYE